MVAAVLVGRPQAVRKRAEAKGQIPALAKKADIGTNEATREGSLKGWLPTLNFS